MSSRSKHYTEDFKQEAVRLALTSGLPRHQIASDLGIGRSTLNTWIKTYRDRDVVAAPGDDVSQELMRLRRENELLRQERDLLKKATAFFAKETNR